MRKISKDSRAPAPLLLWSTPLVATLSSQQAESCPLSHSDPASTAAPSHWLPWRQGGQREAFFPIYTYGYKKRLSNTKHNLYNSKFLHMNHNWISLNFYCNSVFQQCTRLWQISSTRVTLKQFIEQNQSINNMLLFYRENSQNEPVK